MSPAHLVHPEWLAPLLAGWLALGAALGLARLVARRRRRALLGPHAGPGHSERPRHLTSDVALYLALGAIALAALGPRAGERQVRVPGAGVDVVFLVDVSRSMDARDVPPSRLVRAREAVRGLLEHLDPADRAALAAFAGRGVLLTPLTPDRDALAELAGALDTDLLQPASSRLGAGVRAALEAFEEASRRPRVLVVLSDGEDPRGGRDVGGAEAARAGVRVLAAAFGTAAGAMVPDRGAPLRDRSGAVVVTRSRPERLARLAAATGGALLPSDAFGALDLPNAAAALRRDAGSAAGGEPALRRVRAVQVIPLAALAFALLLLEGLPRPRRARLRRSAFAAAAAVLWMAAGPGGGDGPPPRALLEAGLARFERGERDAAARAFSAAALTARDPGLAGLAFYDLGVTELARGDLEAARDAFFDALLLAPGDDEARFNLEWTLRALAREPPRAPAPPRGRGEAPPDAGRREPDGPPPDAAPREAPPAGEPDEAPPGDEADEVPPAGDRPPEATAAPPEPSESQRRRWLERVPDDAARALRARAGTSAPGRPARGPAW